MCKLGMAGNGGRCYATNQKPTVHIPYPLLYNIASHFYQTSAWDLGFNRITDTVN